jgi:hypothetical protein
MLRKVILAAVIALTASAGMTAMDAQAFPLPAPPQSQPVADINDGLQLAAYYRHKRVYRHGRVYHGRAHVHRHWRYTARYGPRYRYRHAGYGYYYGGYWYARPWWGIGVGVPGINLCIGC